jgi:hypothetical protein
MWSVGDMAGSLALGGVTGKREQARKDEFLTRVFASLEMIQCSRS